MFADCDDCDVDDEEKLEPVDRVSRRPEGYILFEKEHLQNDDIVENDELDVLQ